MAFNSSYTWNVSATDTGVALVTRQAGYPLWLAGSTSATIPNCYTVSFSATRDAYVGSGTQSGNNPVPFTVSPVPLNYTLGILDSPSIYTPTIVGPTSPPVPYPVMGVDGSGMPWVYCQAGLGLFINLPSISGSSASQVVVEFEIWLRPGEYSTRKQEFDFAAAVPVAFVNIPSQVACWVRILSVNASTFVVPFPAAATTMYLTFISHNASGLTWNATSGSTGSLTLTGVSVRPPLPVTTSSELARSAMPWESTRLTAVGALFTNVTQVLNKSGTVLCGRLIPQNLSPFLSPSLYASAIASLHPSEKQYLGMETGAYTYCPPSTDLSSFWDYTLTIGNRIVPVYRLDNTSLVNVLIFTPAVDAVLAVSLDWHIEFRTNSVLFPIGLSSLTLETLHQAQISLVKLGFFFQNASHKEALLRITSGVKGVSKPRGQGVVLVKSSRPTPPATTLSKAMPAPGSARRVRTKSKGTKRGQVSRPSRPRNQR